MMNIAISVFRDRISSRIDSADELLFLSMENGEIRKRKTIRIIPSSPIDKIHQIIELHPDVLICGGLTKLCEHKLKNSKINVIPWVKGNTDEVLSEFIKGTLSEDIKLISMIG
jgi:predicted Fe-Mo cluster-binding NifX family protein